MDVTKIRDVINVLRTDIRTVTQNELIATGTTFSEEEKKNINDAVDGVRAVLKQNQWSTGVEDIVSKTDASPQMEKMEKLQENLLDVSVQIEVLIRCGTFDGMDQVTRMLQEGVKEIKEFRSLWTALMREARLVVVAPGSTPVATGGTTVSTPSYNVRQILEAAREKLGAITNTVVVLTDKMEKTVENFRESIADPELNFTQDQWKKIIQLYVDSMKVLSQDGHMMGSIETFFLTDQADFLMYEYYLRNNTPEVDQQQDLSFFLFCTIVQQKIDGRSKNQVQLEESGVMTQAEVHFNKKENNPWPHDNTEAVYFFYKMRTYMKVNQAEIDSNVELQKQYCYMMNRLLPKHMSLLVKHLSNGRKDIFRKPKVFQEEVVHWSKVYKEVEQIWHALGFPDMTWDKIIAILKKDSNTRVSQASSGPINYKFLMGLPADLPCSCCEGKHRFSAKPDFRKNEWVVVCPKMRGKSIFDEDVQPFVEKEKLRAARNRDTGTEGTDQKASNSGGTKKESKPEEKKEGSIYLKKANAAGVRKVLKSYTGTTEQKRKILTAELDALEGGESANVKTVYVSQAKLLDIEVTTLAKYGDKEIKIEDVLLDSGAFVCLFGDKFLREMVETGVLEGMSSLKKSKDRLLVYGVHDNAEETNRFIDMDLFIGETGVISSLQQDLGVQIKGVRMYYLPKADVIIGRPALEPAGLLPEQQLQRLAGTNVKAGSRVLKAEPRFLWADEEMDQDMTGVFPFAASM